MADLDTLLQQTSRTFALTIPLLPDPVRQQVTIAYLLLRIADTLEDDPVMSAETKVEELMAFGRLLRRPTEDSGEFCRRLAALPLTADPACLELVAATGDVLRAFCELSTEAREVIAAHVLMTIEGMASTLERHGNGELQLRSLEDLKRYCFIVAGLVGKLLTELFLLHERSLAPAASVLRSRAGAFGEGLQLTNILKDESADAAQGRRFLPASLSRKELFQLAREDLAEAALYVRLLASSGAARGVLAFTAIPVRLAAETLDAVEAAGPGAKVSRARVTDILAAVSEALDGNGALIPETRPGFSER